VERCLEKDPADRFQTANDLAFALGVLGSATETPHASEPAAESAARPRPHGLRLTLALSGIAAVPLLGAAAVWLPRGATPAPRVIRTELSVRPAAELNAGGFVSTWLPTPGGSRTALAWTPDGQSLVFVGRQGGVQQLSYSLAIQRAVMTSRRTASGSTPYRSRNLPPSPVVTHINLVLNWFEELKAKAPGR
jgi:eukaryotic-like serine/threonine-protein kinase